MKSSKFREFVAQHNAERHLALYARNGNSAFLWLARAEYRKHGVPVPDALEREFDEMGKRLLAVKKVEKLATVLGLTELHQHEIQAKQRDVAEYVRSARKMGHRPGEVEKLAANKFRKSPGAVKTLWRDWNKVVERQEEELKRKDFPLQDTWLPPQS